MFDLNQYLADLETLVNIDSNSAYVPGLKKMVDEIEKLAVRFGLFVRRLPTSELSGDYLIVTNKENAEKFDVMIMGHLDTVQPVGFAKEHPFTVEEDLIHGPGTCDMKAGCLCGLYAVKELDEKTRNKLSIALIFNCDEEIASIYSKNYTVEHAKKSDYAFVMESTGFNPLYTVRRKGLGTYKIKFHGVPGHSGYIFNKFTANAVVEMSRWALELHKMNDRDSLLSVNIGVANGGRLANIVPDYAELTINIRVADKKQYDLFENKMKELASTPMIEGVTTEIEVLSKIVPMNPAPGMNEYLERVKKVFDSIGQEFKVHPLRGGCSDGNLIADAGTRCIDSLGPMGADDHTPKERIKLTDIEPCVMRVKALLEEIALHK